MAAKLAPSVCSVAAVGRTHKLLLLLCRVLRMPREDVAVEVLFDSGLVGTVLTLVLEGSGMLCLDVLVNRRDIFEGTNIVTVGALDGVGGANVRETGLRLHEDFLVAGWRRSIFLGDGPKAKGQGAQTL